MNRLFLTLCAALAALSAYGEQAFVPGEILVKFKNNTVTLPTGATVKKSWPKLGNLKLIKLKNTMSMAQGLSFFKSKSNVAYAEMNTVCKFFANVNDPMFNQQYAMQRIKATPAWDFGTGDPGVIVAVLDSGFQLNHTDMQGKFVQGYDFIGNDTDPTYESQPHGVSVAGCVAPATNNATGIAGIGYNCRIMPIRVGDTGIPQDASISGILHAADNGAKVINMSYGGPGRSQAVQDAVNYAWNKGLVLIASAGNDGGSEENYPAGLDNVISVAATNAADQKAGFSTWGDWVDVAAPGEGVLTTNPNNGYGPADGTSFSSPITAGLAGLLFSLDPVNLTNVQVRDAIVQTCDNVGNFVINGRINAQKAMQMLAAETAPAVEISPISVTTVFGSQLIGDAASVSVSDNVFFQIGSASMTNIGQAATAEATFTVPTDTTRISIRLEALAGIAGGTNNVWLWNWSTSKYELIGSATLVASGDVNKTMDVRRNDVIRYLGANGEVRVLVRGHIPKKPMMNNFPAPFNYRIDALHLLVR